MQEDQFAPLLSVPKRCQDCQKPYSSAELGTDIRQACPGGVCSSCGKPALVDFAREYLHSRRLETCSNVTEGMYHNNFNLCSLIWKTMFAS